MKTGIGRISYERKLTDFMASNLPKMSVAKRIMNVAQQYAA